MGTVFALIFLGELPDKSMFSTLALAARGRPLVVWAGAAAAFLVQTVIAVTAGGLLSLAPRVVVASIAAALFLGGAIYVLRENDEANAEGGADAAAVVGSHRVFATAFLVIFLAEWGDLTQILTANFAARYQAPVHVGVAATLALWSVAAIAVVASRFLQRLPMVAVRRTSAAIMLALAVWSVLSAIES